MCSPTKFLIWPPCGTVIWPPCGTVIWPPCGTVIWPPCGTVIWPPCGTVICWPPECSCWSLIPAFRWLKLTAGISHHQWTCPIVYCDGSVWNPPVNIIIMYIYHALINALSAHMIHINLNMIVYTHVKHSPTKTIYIKYYKNKNKTKNALQTHTHTHIHWLWQKLGTDIS